MQIVRLFSGEDGESHFENLGLDSTGRNASGCRRWPNQVSSKPAGSYSDFHNAPSRLCVVQLAGEIVTKPPTVARSIRWPEMC